MLSRRHRGAAGWSQMSSGLRPCDSAGTGRRLFCVTASKEPPSGRLVDKGGGCGDVASFQDRRPRQQHDPADKTLGLKLLMRRRNNGELLRHPRVTMTLWALGNVGIIDRASKAGPPSLTVISSALPRALGQDDLSGGSQNRRPRLPTRCFVMPFGRNYRGVTDLRRGEVCY